MVADGSGGRGGGGGNGPGAWLPTLADGSGGGGGENGPGAWLPTLVVAWLLLESIYKIMKRHFYARVLDIYHVVMVGPFL